MHPRQRPWLALSLALAAAVTVAALLPAGSPGPAPSGSVGLGVAIGVDKVLHAAGFFAIAVTAGCAAGGRQGVDPRRALLLVAVLAVALATGTELAQSVVPGRTPDVFDLLADVVGVVVGLAVPHVRRWRRQ